MRIQIRFYFQGFKEPQCWTISASGLPLSWVTTFWLLTTTSIIRYTTIGRNLHGSMTQGDAHRSNRQKQPLTQLRERITTLLARPLDHDLSELMKTKYQTLFPWDVPEDRPATLKELLYVVNYELEEVAFFSKEQTDQEHQTRIDCGIEHGLWQDKADGEIEINAAILRGKNVGEYVNAVLAIGELNRALNAEAVNLCLRAVAQGDQVFFQAMKGMIRNYTDMTDKELLITGIRDHDPSILRITQLAKRILKPNRDQGLNK